jgi:hypothetical protein
MPLQQGSPLLPQCVQTWLPKLPGTHVLENVHGDPDTQQT